ncbi:adenylate/guanylate cyclase domain-containing protein [Arenibacterium halophilum]|uniref:Adenylate/guanylate cyclase domain-containing protein n=1 Tax=Arenibacterium halophilum TaxID=2583821 RepID=A0ABY2X6W9_9RHOB|nr:adenylate/guanylate cyclase domain-containing protein [Arenibacterium halophilum]TMV10882.1 adenylate/guanylate cyclase domain-containing protein [Arenibacterium halophilum]
MPFACVLISDITGSTTIYEREGNAAAVSYIEPIIGRMRAIIGDNGGICVKSEGDDTVSFFRHPDDAFRAAWTMINEDWHQGMSVHAGMYYGEIVQQVGTIYGNAVNTAARLSSLAKPGEVLVGVNCYDVMSQDNKARLMPIGDLHLKGKEEPTKVYAASMPSLAATTVIFSSAQTRRPSRTEAVELTYQGRTWRIGEGEKLSLGRSQDCDIVLDHAWVSRKHGELTIRQWQLEYSDHSSAGSVVETPDGKELSIHRRSTMLNGSGTILLGPRSTENPEASAVTFVSHTLSIQPS